MRLPLPIRIGLCSIAAGLAPLAVVALVAERHQPFRVGMFVNRAGIDVGAGRVAFDQHCAVCHSIDAKATVSPCPNLHEIGRTASGRRTGVGAAEFLLESILDPVAYREPNVVGVMPQDIARGLRPDEVRNLVGFLSSLSAEPDLDRIARLEVPDRPNGDESPAKAPVRRAQVELGQSVFEDKAQCFGCHSLHQYRRLRAPSLALASYFDEDYLLESILEPSRVIVPGYELVSAALQDGRVLTGRLLSEGDDELVLLSTDAKGNADLINIPIDAIAEDEEGARLIQSTASSSMPDGFHDLLTEEEIDALIAMLKSLN